MRKMYVPRRVLRLREICKMDNLIGRVQGFLPGLCPLVTLLICSQAVLIAQAQTPTDVHQQKIITFPANLDGGWRKTQFFAPDYNTAVGQWDSRIEGWLPPRKAFSYGPYLRVAGIAGSQDDAWQNGWLAAPGLGIQAFPFSTSNFRTGTSPVGAWFGPLRAFGEYNFVNYWGSTNTWRPRQQVRSGFDYWKAIGVNELSRPWWTEIWNGLYWQSSNEFTDRYDSVVFANSMRVGARYPNHGPLSAVTPYAVLQSSLTKYHHGGPATDFYWENGLVGGGGLRVTPSLHSQPNSSGITRFVIYAEYLNTATYYGPTAPASVPRYDVHAGVSFSVGNWYQ